MVTHYFRWLVFNILFAFIPLAAVVVVDFRTNDVFSWSTITSNSHELLFIGLTMAATTLGDTIDLVRITKRVNIYTGVLVLLILLVTLQAMLYGIEVSSAVQSNSSAGNGMFSFAFWAALCTLILCLFVQYDIGEMKNFRMKENENNASS